MIVAKIDYQQNRLSRRVQGRRPCRTDFAKQSLVRYTFTAMLNRWSGEAATVPQSHARGKGV